LGDTVVPAGRAYNAATPIVEGSTVIYAGSGRGTKAVKIEKLAMPLQQRSFGPIPIMLFSLIHQSSKEAFFMGFHKKATFSALTQRMVKPFGLRRWAPRILSVVDAGSVLMAIGTRAN
jgi:hypothetical protein